MEQRFLVTHVLAALALPESYQTLLPMLAEPDLRVAVRADEALARGLYATDEHRLQGYGSLLDSDLFERLEALQARLPRQKQILPLLVWPWSALEADQQDVSTTMVRAIGQRPVTRLLPYLHTMDAWGRCQVSDLITKQPVLDTTTRATLFKLIADRSPYVRQKAVKVAATCHIPCVPAPLN